MSNSRDSIAKIIEQLQQNAALLDQLKPSAFESLAAELLAQNNKILEVQRQIFKGADYVAKIQDSLGAVQSIAIEIKKGSRVIDSSVVERFLDSIAPLNFAKGYLITNSSFTEAAKQIAEKSKNMIELIDRAGVQSLIEQYRLNQEVFASYLFQRVQSLDMINLIEIPEPEASQIEAIDPEDTGLSEPQRSALVSVSSLPLRLISRILRAPHELNNLTPRQFEEFIAETLAQLGFRDVTLTPRSRDGGKDVIASHQVNGIPLSFYFECKKYADGHKVQLETLRALLGTLAHEARDVNKGVLVTTSTFTKGAKKFILGEARLDGKDYDGILGWIDELRKKI